MFEVIVNGKVMFHIFHIRFILLQSPNHSDKHETKNKFIKLDCFFQRAAVIQRPWCSIRTLAVVYDAGNLHEASINLDPRRHEEYEALWSPNG